MWKFFGYAIFCFGLAIGIGLYNNWPANEGGLMFILGYFMPSFLVMLLGWGFIRGVKKKEAKVE